VKIWVSPNTLEDYPTNPHKNSSAKQDMRVVWKFFGSLRNNKNGNKISRNENRKKNSLAEVEMET
jgi:hypothetical protein